MLCKCELIQLTSIYYLFLLLPTLQMASLTPGTLDKLLHKDFKVAGEHRSALLQVISIVPSLEDDPWKSRGYFLRVSDSVHSAYVSVSDGDVELILSDKIQLGQFIHVTWLDSGSPVPVLRGLKPIPKRRPCVGEPKDLISSDFLNSKKVEAKVKSKGKLKKVVGNEEGNVRRISLGNGKLGGLGSRRLSLDSSRKGWDRSPQSRNGGRDEKSKTKDNLSSLVSVVTNKVFPHDSPKGSSISPLTSKNVIVSPNHLSKPIIKNLKSSDDGIFPSHFNKVALSAKNWSDSKILWNSLPSTICDLGKEVRSYRNVSFVSAVRALEEVSVYDGVLQCMSMFAELRESSEKEAEASGPLIEQFLKLHESMKKAAIVVSSLINMETSARDSNNCSSRFSESGKCLSPASKNASLWVQAAVQTDLSKFSLYAKEEEKGISNCEKRHYVVIENTPVKVETENHSPDNKKNSINHASSKSVPKVKELSSHSRRHLSNTKGTIAGLETWSEGSGWSHVADLAQKLLSSSRAWFLDYLEDSLNNGFRLKSKEDTSQITVLLGQLKRVNQWLDEAFQEDGRADERINSLKKKLYRFLLNHVDSAVPRR
ncbi:uncharacterized protein LOC105168452 [Sesamum indicum]|uniref:Uncharacterized protein LOC105168452 n=1 Tax=Sesamum indicum TaxID=4182 RepID=A0A6I9TTA2_SESIN|nr:uncharacterized protein LOC105168452 [Sesamum indicum]